MIHDAGGERQSKLIVAYTIFCWEINKQKGPDGHKYVGDMVKHVRMGEAIRTLPPLPQRAVRQNETAYTKAHATGVTTMPKAGTTITLEVLSLLLPTRDGTSSGNVMEHFKPRPLSLHWHIVKASTSAW